MAGVAVTSALLVPLSIFGGPAFAGSGSAAGQYGSGSSQYQYKVTICHLTGSKKHPAHDSGLVQGRRGAPPPWRSPRRLHRHREAEAEEAHHDDHHGHDGGPHVTAPEHGKGHEKKK